MRKHIDLAQAWNIIAGWPRIIVTNPTFIFRHLGYSFVFRATTSIYFFQMNVDKTVEKITSVRLAFLICWRWFQPYLLLLIMNVLVITEC